MPRAIRPSYGTTYDRLFFTADEPTNGRELWITDGTTTGTIEVLDLAAGSGSGVLGRVLQAGVGRRAVFAGIDAAFGQEIWVSDGSLTGTQRLFDLNPGVGHGLPGYSPVMAVAGDTVFFVGDDGTTGGELFAFPAALLEASEAERFGAGCAGTIGVPTIDYVGAPALGNGGFAVEVLGTLPSFPVILLGSNTRTDLPIGSGCTIYPTGPDITIPSTSTPGGVGQVPVPVPSSASLIGAELTLQWATIDPAGSFLNLAAFTGGLRVRVGSS